MKYLIFCSSDAFFADVPVHLMYALLSYFIGTTTIVWSKDTLSLSGILEPHIFPPL